MKNSWLSGFLRLNCPIVLIKIEHCDFWYKARNLKRTLQGGFFRIVTKKVPLLLRLRVKTVITDLSSAMMLTVRTAFPKAKLVNDRFQVQ